MIRHTRKLFKEWNRFDNEMIFNFLNDDSHSICFLNLDCQSFRDDAEGTFCQLMFSFVSLLFTKISSTSKKY